jgi:hypothetical protein
VNDDAKDVLSGSKLERIEQRGTDVVIIAEGGRDVVFSADRMDGECRLVTAVHPRAETSGRPRARPDPGPSMTKAA